MDLNLIAKYKQLFGIRIPVTEFPIKKLKSRWRTLSLKYHPDKGGKKEHFIFVQDAYKYLKGFCKTGDELDDITLTSEKFENYGIKEIKVRVGDSYSYIWDIGVGNYV